MRGETRRQPALAADAQPLGQRMIAAILVVRVGQQRMRARPGIAGHAVVDERNVRRGVGIGPKPVRTVKKHEEDPAKRPEEPQDLIGVAGVESGRERHRAVKEPFAREVDRMAQNPTGGLSLHVHERKGRQTGVDLQPKCADANSARLNFTTEAILPFIKLW